MSEFLDDDALFVLTGYKWHSKQIEELRKQGVPFRVNAAGRPAVTWAAINGSKQAPDQPKKWVPSWAKAA